MSEPMITIADCTSPGLIIPQVRGRDAATVIGELSSLLHKEGRLKEWLPFYNAVMSREALISTAMAPGWALPHARFNGVARLCFAVGQSRDPITWPGDEGVAVKTVFLLAVPEADAADHITLISGLARLSQNEVLLERLTQASDKNAMFEIFQKVPLRQPRPTAARK